MRCLEAVGDGYMEVETFAPAEKRTSYEKIRCRTESGIPEFENEVMRVEKIRATESEWSPVVVRLLDPWGLVEQRRVIA